MKKISLAILASLALFAISCENSLEPVSPAENNENNLIQMTFKATTNTTKTEIGALSGSQYPVIWSDSDKIKVIAVDASGAVLSETVFDIVAGGSSTASFTGTTNGTAAAYYAIYPSTYTTTVSGTGSSATVALTDYKSHDVVAVQDGFDSSRAVMFAVADSEASFAFMHGVSFFKITVAPSDVSEIEFRVPSSDGGARIFGNPTYKFSDGSTSAYNGADKNNNYVTLKPSSGTLVQGGTYYVPFAAKNSSLSTYLQITYTFSNNATVSKKTTKLNGKFDNGTVYDLGTPPFSLAPTLSLLKTVVNNISSDAATGLTIADAYHLSNCTDSDVAVTCDGTVITAASISGGTVTYSISANGSENAREGSIYLKLGENPTQTITVNQLASGSSVTTVTYTWNFSTYYSETSTLNAGEYTFNAAEDASAVLTYKTSKTNDKIGSSSGLYYLQPNGSASATDRVLSFTSPGDGTLTITGCSNGTNTRTLTVKNASGDTIVATSGGTSSSSTPTNHVYSVPAGKIIIYPDNIFRFYELVYTNE